MKETKPQEMGRSFGLSLLLELGSTLFYKAVQPFPVTGGGAWVSRLTGAGRGRQKLETEQTG